MGRPLGDGNLMIVVLNCSALEIRLAMLIMYAQPPYFPPRLVRRGLLVGPAE